MAKRAYAPGGRIDEATLSAIEASQARGQAFDLSDRHVERIRQGQHWAEGWRPRTLPVEAKVCVTCGCTFTRRKDNGLLHTPKLWANKVACSNRCNTQAMWARGVYKNRVRSK